MKNILCITCCLLITFLVFNPSAHAQKTSKDKVSTLFEEGNFVFKPTRASAQGGINETVTDQYYLKISKDTLKLWVPYFSKEEDNSFGASFDKEYRFISTEFSYKTRVSKKGAWRITIDPKTHGIKVREIVIFYRKGTATARITSPRRDPISYYGNIQKLE